MPLQLFYKSYNMQFNGCLRCLPSFVSSEFYSGFLSYVHSPGILFRFSLVCPFPRNLIPDFSRMSIPRHFMPTKKRRGHPHRFPFLVVPRDYIPLPYFTSCPVIVYSFSPRRMKIWPLRRSLRASPRPSPEGKGVLSMEVG